MTEFKKQTSDTSREQQDAQGQTLHIISPNFKGYNLTTQTYSP